MQDETPTGRARKSQGHETRLSDYLVTVPHSPSVESAESHIDVS